MSMPFTQAGLPVPFTQAQTGNTFATGYTNLNGIFVSSATTATIAISDGTNVIVPAFTVAAATWYPLPFICKTSVVLTLTGTVSGTLSLA